VTQHQQFDILRRLTTTTSHDESQQHSKGRIQSTEEHLDDHAGALPTLPGWGYAPSLAGVTAADIEVFVPHQANLRITESIRRRGPN
jgi:3-oxoacyl-[acyl-carrier-protein] synthase III